MRISGIQEISEKRAEYAGGPASRGPAHAACRYAAFAFFGRFRRFLINELITE